jgi:hypothetical protein
MPQRCKVCKHANRQAIDAALLEGYPALRAIGEQYGVSKDSLSRHFHAHIPDDAGDEDDDQDGDDLAGLSLAVTEKGPDEARQVCEIAEQKKEPADDSTVTNSEDLHDAEAHYSAFLDRWRGRISIGRDEMAAWKFEQTEEIEGLLDEAIRRGDLWRIGQFYGQTFKTIARFCNPRA